MRTFTFATLAVAAFAIPLALRSVADSPPAPETPVQVIHVEIADLSFSTYSTLATDCVEMIVQGSEPAYTAGGFPATKYKAEFVASVSGALDQDLSFFVGGSEELWPILRLHGAPTFAANERVVAFLTKDPLTGEIGLLGLAQGVYRVHGESNQVSGLYALPGETAAQFRARVAAEL